MIMGQGGQHWAQDGSLVLDTAALGPGVFFRKKIINAAE